MLKMERRNIFLGLSIRELPGGLLYCVLSVPKALEMSIIKGECLMYSRGKWGCFFWVISWHLNASGYISMLHRSCLNWPAIWEILNFYEINLRKKTWKCILLILIENKQVEFSPLWFLVNKKSSSSYSPFTQDRQVYILLRENWAYI